MRRIAALLFATMLVCSLGSCSQGGPETQKPSMLDLMDEESQSDNGGTDAAEGDAAAEDKGSKALSSVKPEKATIEETVLLDEAGVKVTAKSLDLGGWYGPELKLLIENNSGKNLTFQTRKSTVNGYMCETMMSCDVANGKKANDTLAFSGSQLNASGVESIAEMEFIIHTFDSDSWDDYYNSEPVTLKTSIADSYEQVYDDSGEVVYDGNGIKIAVKGLFQDESWMGPSVVVEIINSREDDVEVQTRNTSVNGFMVEPYFSCEVCAGKRAVDGITFSSSELESNDIESIEDMELSFHVFDSDSWETIVDTDVVTISF